MTQKTATTLAKTADSEKITINLGFVDLGQIDLLVAEGFYANKWWRARRWCSACSTSVPPICRP
jgi:Ribbon-Helix-Helix transcriptional regulator family